jgi:gliding motility-associated-like protein
MKKLTFLFAFITSFVFSQNCPYLGPDQFLPCGVNSTTLTADFSQCGVGVNPNQTTNYSVTTIPYVVQNNTGTQLFMSDDSQQGPFNIGFTFCFFGQTYTQFYVGSNGWISFSPTQPTTFTSTTIPSNAATVPVNCIMGPWQDWHPGVGGQIRYQVQGTAPCRKLVVSWIGVPMYSCTNLTGTFHIVLYESTNVIENHIQTKPNCATWAGGTAVQGIQNNTGTFAVSVPGRNSTQWTANNDARRYTPSGPAVLPTPTWYIVGNPNPIGTGNSITVTPPTAGANYTCQLVYPSCNAGWNTCNNIVGSGPDTVFVQPGPPSLPNPIVNSIDPTCFNDCDGTITVTPVGGTGTIDISWGVLGSTFTINNLCSGNYSFDMVDDTGCTYSSSVTINNPPQLTINPIVGSDTLCYDSQNNQFTVSSVSPNLNYTWTTTTGSITNGQGTDIINLDVSNINGGLYPTSLSVIGIDINGCESLPETYDVFVFNLIPTINAINPLCDYDNCVPIVVNPIGGTLVGPNVSNNQFCPDSTVTGLNTISYTYIQSNCEFNATSQIEVYPRPIVNNVTNNLGQIDYQFSEICEGFDLTNTYNPTSTGGLYTWYAFGDTIESQNIILTWDDPGFYTFYVTTVENGCVSYPKEYNVAIQRCPQELIFIPNTFTPDGDEVNQLWQPIFTQGYDPFDFNMTVFNRWGQIVWESYDASVGWDGTFNGKECSEGVYTWMVKFGVLENDNKVVKHGHLTLIR